MYNVTEDQVDEAVGQVIETLQLPPDLADDFFSMIIHWLDDNDVEIIE
jgi:hypothetical protein